jgi:hypothetical protein
MQYYDVQSYLYNLKKPIRFLNLPVLLNYGRYLAEFKTGAERKESAESTMVAYKAAQVCSFFLF